MIEGALMVLAGILVGRFLPGRRTRTAPTKPDETRPVCGCGHGFHDHDAATHGCHGKVKKYRWDSVIRREVLDGYVNCTCHQYTGPQPLPEYYAPDTVV